MTNKIGYEEWLAELAQYQERPEHPGFATVAEMASASGQTKQTVRDNLRLAEANGRLQKQMVYRMQICGHEKRVPGYRLLPEGES